MRNSVPYVLPDCAADVMQKRCQLDSAILPRAQRVDQSTERPGRLAINAARRYAL